MKRTLYFLNDKYNSSRLNKILLNDQLNCLKKLEREIPLS